MVRLGLIDRSHDSTGVGDHPHEVWSLPRSDSRSSVWPITSGAVAPGLHPRPDSQVILADLADPLPDQLGLRPSRQNRYFTETDLLGLVEVDARLDHAPTLHPPRSEVSRSPRSTRQ